MKAHPSIWRRSTLRPKLRRRSESEIFGSGSLLPSPNPGLLDGLPTDPDRRLVVAEVGDLD